MSGQESDGQARALGRVLATTRVEQGRSPAEVAASINLRETVVRAIEGDDFTLCGGDVYARGHIRAYARLLGLDAGPLLAAYTERTGRANPASGAVHLLDDDVDVPLERAGPNWALVVGGALAVLVAFLAVQLVSDLRGPGRPSTEVAQPVTTGRTPPGTTTGTGTATTAPPSPSASGTATTSPTPATPSTGPSTKPPVSGVAVAIKVTGDSWVQVRDAAGNTVYSGLLGKGDAKRFTDDTSLRLTLGNAGGVQLTVNGRSLGVAGRTGEVKRMTFRPGDAA